MTRNVEKNTYKLYILIVIIYNVYPGPTEKMTIIVEHTQI